MEKKDIEHLATLARIELTEEEAEALAADITDILRYIGEIQEITALSQDEKKVGALHNVMREDGEPHESGIYSEDLLDAAPERKEQYIQVQKILDNE